MGLLDEISKHITETYDTLSKGRAGGRGRGLMEMVEGNVRKGLPLLDKNPRDWTSADVLNVAMGGTISGYGKAKALARDLDTKYPDITADISAKDNYLTLDRLEIDKELRRQGLGSRFMEDLTQYADDTGRQVRLTADGDFGGSKAGQQRFYRRHGFVPNRGRARDYTFQDNMYRDPKSLIGALGLYGLLSGNEEGKMVLDDRQIMNRGLFGER